MTIRLVIADDHGIIREGIKSVLAARAEYEVVAEASDGVEAVGCVKQWKPDILLLDITMPNLGGLDIIEQVQQVSPGTKIMIVSMHKLGAYILKALRQGVSAYLNKDKVAEELIPALERVRAGKTYLGEEISQYLAESVRSSEKGPGEGPGSFRDLFSEREMDVLRLTAEGKTAKEIAKTLFLSPRTVENYKNVILKKLNLRKTSDLIKYVIENRILE